MVLIKGLQKTSLVDYPAKVACVIFTAGCNFKCPFCQNPDLIEKERYDRLETTSEEYLLEFLESRKKWIDGVVITGGEPTLHKDLPQLIARIKELGFLVKLDTNGSNPGMIEELTSKGLVDFIAMDVKAPAGDYSRAAGVPADEKKIQESIRLIREAGDGQHENALDYEFRTTVVPGIVGEKELGSIGKMLSGARKLALQQFDNRNTFNQNLRQTKPYTKEDFAGFKKQLEPFFGEVETRAD